MYKKGLKNPEDLPRIDQTFHRISHFRNCAFNVFETRCDHYFARGSEGNLFPCEFCGAEPILRFSSLESYYDEKSFSEGQSADFEDKNPYVENTNSWFNWNKGKNTNKN